MSSPWLYGVEPDKEQRSTFKELLRIENQEKESLTEVSQIELNISSWPTTRPSFANRVATIERFNERYDLYMWWQEGYLFGEAVPLGGSEIFICSPAWLIVQEVGNFVSAFDTVKFEDSNGSSVCDDFSFPVVFYITQWEFIHDFYADFSQPFNLVWGNNASVAVTINGGVSANNTTVSSNRATLGSDLGISIPSTDLQTTEGIRDIWLDLEYRGEVDGNMTWILRSAGYND